MRRMLSAAALSVLLLVSVGSPVFAVTYLSAIADLPLPDGVAEQTDKSTVFDAPMGRIITAYASGQADADDVRDFYDDALPPLGWDKTGEGSFRRGAEVLKIDVLGGQDGSPVNVSFTLSAESQPQ